MSSGTVRRRRRHHRRRPGKYKKGRSRTAAGVLGVQSLNAASTGRTDGGGGGGAIIKSPLWTANETDDSSRRINIAAVGRFAVLFKSRPATALTRVRNTHIIHSGRGSLVARFAK